MRNNGRAARFLQTWWKDYIYQTLISTAAASGAIYTVIVDITIRMLQKGLKQAKI